MYAEALSEILSYAAGTAAASAIGNLIEGRDEEGAGVVERAERADARRGRIGFVVAGVVALALAFSLFRWRR